ncbi:serine/threonine-protein kinase [Gardnerella vaginalis]|uniref:serine/threonine-protein kinase n=1 Tax=Gardnerella vaginalis TaxID=2702 RepID=UPI0039EE5CEA
MEDTSMFDLQPGNNVGGYTLISRLGGGAMGSVWRVNDDGGNQYAMKILRASVNAKQSEEEDSEQERARMRLKREALALQRIHHPGVCAIVDMELDASIAFIVTELIEGHNLREDVDENGPYIADDLERLAHKLIEAVKAVHEAGIVHRDIKPTNVMISATGPVLVDFGIAMGEGESHVTRTGLVMGTPGFIAPEIIEGGDSDELTDWWSVAAVLAFAATGKPVFGIKPMMAVLERAASGNADLTGLPPRTMAAFRKALNPIREQRCMPSDLENAISQDAMDPLAWPEMNRPFDRNATNVTMREMWRATNRETIRETKEKTAILTNSPACDAAGTVGADSISNLNSDEEAPTVTVRSTTVMPHSLDSEDDKTSYVDEKTRINALKDVDFQNIQNDNSNNSRIAQSSKLIHPSDSTFDNGNIENEAGDSLHVKSDEVPSANRVLNQHDYARRGTWILLICVIFHLAIACLSILDSIGFAMVFMWISATSGYSISSSLRRMQLNDGIIPRHDSVVRVATLPWHIIRGFVYMLPRVIAIVISGGIGAVIYPFFCGDNPELLSIDVGSLRILLPAYSPNIFSNTAFGYALGFMVAWVVFAVVKWTTKFRLGLGALFYSGKSFEK